MKQFLTLCMATAMIGTAAASPKVTLREAMQLKSEGKATMVQGMTRQNGVKALQNKPVSAFHKLQAEKAEKAMKAPAKAMANGDAIYGNLVYSDSGEMETGFYELEGAAGNFLWTNDFAAAGATLSYDPEAECLKGYYPDIFWGMLFGVYYVEMNIETGEVTVLEEQDPSIDGYMQVAALDDEGYFYGFGAVDGVSGLVKAPAAEPFNYEYVAPATFCNGFTYNTAKGVFFGIDNNGYMVEITKDGQITELDNVYASVPDFYPYLGGLVYDGPSGLYYWNGQKEMGSGVYTINPDTYAVDLVGECPDGEEYMSFVTTDFKVVEGMPNAPTAVAVNFKKDAMMGTVDFVLPTELKDGTAIEGRIQYKAYLNGDLYTTGSQAAGAEVTIPYVCESEGINTFALSVVVNGVESKQTSIRAWIGNDYPMNPTNVVLTAESLTWDAVPTGEGVGVHGGYVADGSVTYSVMINDVLKATGLADCTFDPGFDPEDIVEAYKAIVWATSNGLESVNSPSNTIVTGAPYNVPITFEPTPEEFAVSTVYDGNGGYGFQNGVDAQGYYVQCGYTNSKDVPMDAWYFLPPVAIEDVTKFYTFSVDACYRSSSYPEEAFEVVICNEPSINGVVGTIIDYTALESQNYQTFSDVFRVRQAGTYYIALHCVSEGDQLGIKARNFQIMDENITLQSPAQAEYLSAEETAKGELAAYVSFQFPKTNLAENDLAADTELVATVSSSIDSVTVTGTPGLGISNLMLQTVQGDNEITIVVTDPATGLNSPKASTDVYTGVTVPATPTNLQGSTSKDNLTLTLTWDAVTEPDDADGIIDPADVSYIIYGYFSTIFGSYWSPIDYTNETYYDYTVGADSEQEFVALGVGSQNAAGTNGYLLYVQDNVGAPYQLPMFEDFDPNGFQTGPWIIGTYADVEGPQWSVYEMNDLYEGEEGGFLAALGNAGAAGMLYMPRFCTFSNSETIRVTFDICAEFALPTITILGETYGSDLYELGELTVEEGEGFKQAYIDLPTELMNQYWVQLYIAVEFQTGGELLAISNIDVDCPTGVQSVAAGEGIRIAGGKNQINVSGLNGHSVIVSTLDGKVAAKQLNATSNATFNVEKGVYVVKAGDKNAKVVVK